MSVPMAGADQPEGTIRKYVTSFEILLSPHLLVPRNTGTRDITASVALPVPESYYTPPTTQRRISSLSPDSVTASKPQLDAHHLMHASTFPSFITDHRPATTLGSPAVYQHTVLPQIQQLHSPQTKTLARPGRAPAKLPAEHAVAGDCIHSGMSSDDDEGTTHRNTFASTGTVYSPFRNLDEGDSEAVSGIAAMSLSFIINGEMKQTTEVDDDDGSSSAGGSSRGGFDLSSMLNTVCAKTDCYRTIRGPSGTFCKYHKQSRFCRADACEKSAKTGGFCISHGGGKRCAHPDCNKSAKQGGLCISHGGGKRCSEADCTKSALVGGFCSAHGGGRKCQMPGCTKTALLGGLCIAHGGGKRCQVTGCSKSAVGGTLCVSHGGGKRCQAEGCNKGAVRNGVCIRHGAKRDQPLVSP